MFAGRNLQIGVSAATTRGASTANGRDALVPVAAEANSRCGGMNPASGQCHRRDRIMCSGIKSRMSIMPSFPNHPQPSTPHRCPCNPQDCPCNPQDCHCSLPRQPHRPLPKRHAAKGNTLAWTPGYTWSLACHSR